MDHPAPAAALRPLHPLVLPAADVPRLSVVVVNYLHWHDTADLVGRLRQTPAARRGEAEVVVVDNHSPWHPLLPRLRRMDGVSLRRWRRNRGFARAVNEGCRLSRGDWFLLLNPDMSLAPDFLDRVLARASDLAHGDRRTGIVGLGLYDADGVTQASAGPFPTLAGTLARLLLPRSRRKYYFHRGDRPRPVDWVTGCCLLVRRACWDDLGGLDPEFFLYYEDVDLCRRARRRGWQVWYDPTLAAVHHHPLHRRVVPPHLRLITRHALLTYARKHWPHWQLRTLAGVVRLEAWLRKRHARNRRDDVAAETFRNLGILAQDLARGRRGAARLRLLRVVRGHESALQGGAVGRDPGRCREPSGTGPAHGGGRP
jgi:GT2 family glycosyltransferase